MLLCRSRRVRSARGVSLWGKGHLVEPKGAVECFVGLTVNSAASVSGPRLPGSLE